MSQVMVDPSTLLEYLHKLQADVGSAITWVEKHAKPFLIEAPNHIGPNLGSQAGGCFARPDVRVDDQIAVEVLWVVEDAMDSKGSAPPKAKRS